MRPIIIGVAGAHSGSGKTTCVSQLLKELKGWGAIKYTRTAIYSSITDDIGTLSIKDKDTKMFLDAGAEKVLWVQSPVSEIKELLSIAIERLSGLKGILVEGNSAIEFLRPDIIIFIFGRDPKRIKESSRRVLKIADAAVFDEEPGIELPGNIKKFSRTRNNEKLIPYILKMIENKEKIRAVLKERAIDGKISCQVARRIANELTLPYGEIGKAADELEIKIADCELGCF